jgi:hypothetical protein
MSEPLEKKTPEQLAEDIRTILTNTELDEKKRREAIEEILGKAPAEVRKQVEAQLATDANKNKEVGKEARSEDQPSEKKDPKAIADSLKFIIEDEKLDAKQKVEQVAKLFKDVPKEVIAHLPQEVQQTASKLFADAAATETDTQKRNDLAGLAAKVTGHDKLPEGKGDSKTAVSGGSNLKSSQEIQSLEQGGNGGMTAKLAEKAKAIGNHINIEGGGSDVDPVAQAGLPTAKGTGRQQR